MPEPMANTVGQGRHGKGFDSANPQHMPEFIVGAGDERAERKGKCSIPRGKTRKKNIQAVDTMGGRGW